MLTATVIPGYQFTPNEKATTPKLNLLGQPVIAFSGTIGASEISDDAIGAAKLKQDAFAYSDGIYNTVPVNHYQVNLSPDMAVLYTTGAIVRFKADTTNVAGGVDLDVDARGRKDLVKLVYNNGSQQFVELDAGDIRKDQIVECIYNGTRFQLLGPLGNRPTEYVTATGTDSYSVSCTPPYATLAALRGKFLRVLFTNANTGACTLAVDGLAPTAIRRNKDVALVAGDIKANQELDLCYDGTYLTVVSQMGAAPLEYSGVDTGAAGSTSTTTIILPSLGYTSYAQMTGRLFSFLPIKYNIGPTTLQISGLASPPGIRLNNRDISSGENRIGQMVPVIFDGANFQMLTPPQQSLIQAFIKFTGAVTSKSVTNALPGSNQLTVTGHGIIQPGSIDTLQKVAIRSTGTIPGGLVANTPYWVRVVDVNTLTFHTTAAGAMLNTNIITLSGAGTGTTNLDYCPYSVRYRIDGAIPMSSAGSLRTGMYLVQLEFSFASVNWCPFAMCRAQNDNRSAAVAMDFNGGGVSQLSNQIYLTCSTVDAAPNQFAPLDVFFMAAGFLI